MLNYSGVKGANPYPDLSLPHFSLHSYNKGLHVHVYGQLSLQAQALDTCPRVTPGHPLGLGVYTLSVHSAFKRLDMGKRSAQAGKGSWGCLGRRLEVLATYNLV